MQSSHCAEQQSMLSCTHIPSSPKNRIKLNINTISILLEPRYSAQNVRTNITAEPCHGLFSSECINSERPRKSKIKKNEEEKNHLDIGIIMSIDTCNSTACVPIM